MVETWTANEVELVNALQNPKGRVFRTRSGKIVSDVRTVDTLDDYPYYSELQGWYYTVSGRLFDNRSDSSDLVAVFTIDDSIQTVVVETGDNPEFLRLLEFARNEDCTDIIHREYAGYRLLPDLSLKMLGHTGKRKPVTWESASKLRQCLDLDRVFDSLPWTIVDGEDIHQAFEQHRPGSCMRDTCKHDLRQLYALNPDQVKVAYQAKGTNGLLQGAISCLVWYGKETVYIDRRYSEGYLPDTKEPLIRSLARQLKTSTGKDVKLVWKGEDVNGLDTISKPVQFTLNRDSDLMPWCDSIRYVVEYDDDSVTLSTNEGHGRICCQDQIGQDITESSSRCCNCSYTVSDDDCRMNDNGDSYCDSCYSDLYTNCEWSEQDYPVDDVNCVRVYSYGSAYNHRRFSLNLSARWHDVSISDNALDDDFTETPSGMVHNDLAIEDNRGEYHCPDDDTYCMTKDGEAYNPDDVVQLENGEYHPSENCTEIDGIWYLNEGTPSTDDDTEDTTVPEVCLSPSGIPMPPGYRLAVPGEILPYGSLYPCGKDWERTGESGRLYGETSLGLSCEYLIPIVVSVEMVVNP